MRGGEREGQSSVASLVDDWERIETISESSLDVVGGIPSFGSGEFLESVDVSLDTQRVVLGASTTNRLGMIFRAAGAGFGLSSSDDDHDDRCRDTLSGDGGHWK